MPLRSSTTARSAVARRGTGILAAGALLLAGCSGAGAGQATTEPSDTVITSVITVTRTRPATGSEGTAPGGAETSTGAPSRPETTPPGPSSASPSPSAPTGGTTDGQGGLSPATGFAGCAASGLISGGSGDVCAEGAPTRVPADQAAIWCSAPASVGFSHLKIPYSVTLPDGRNQTNWRTIYPDSVGHGPGARTLRITPELMRLPGDTLLDGLYLCEWYSGDTLLGHTELQVGAMPEDDTGQTAVH